MLDMPGKKWENANTVFSVKKCRNPGSVLRLTPWTNREAKRSTGGAPNFCSPGPLGFSVNETEKKRDHGNFHCPTGVFTVKTPGIYLFHFSGYYHNTRGSGHPGAVELKMNSSTTIAKSIDSDAVRRSKIIEYPPIAVSALLPLKTGDTINAFANMMNLRESSPTYVTRFTGILLSDD